MQRLKKAAWHLPVIQHDAILIVVGPANKHRPRRVVLMSVLRRIFRTLRGSRPMGKAIAIFFGFSALIIVAGSFAAPGTVSAGKHGCSPAYGVDPCTTASVK
jgi:hypothetical protein